MIGKAVALGRKEDRIGIDESIGQLWSVSKVSSDFTTITRLVINQ